MINVSDGFHAAVIGVSRKMLARAVVEIIDPDITYSTSVGSGVAPWAKPEQLSNRVMTLQPRYTTLERNRWLLDGTAKILPDDPAQATGEIAHVGDVLCDADGYFDPPVYVEQPFSNVSVLQICSVYFPEDDLDGYPVDFRIGIYSGSDEIFGQDFTGNTARRIVLTDFTVYDPTAIRLTVTRWSLGGRRIRVPEIIPGLYEEWSLSSIVSLDIQMRGNFSGLALPYGTANLRIKNTDRRFEPFTRSGIFKSIEERQAIPISLGPVQAAGTVEYAPVGVFFQKSGGWDTGKNDMYIDWQLVDICGLLADRDFQIPTTLPTTLGGWFECFVAQLGENFKSWYHVDPEYAELPLTINDRSQLINRKCGAMIRYACMATGTWPRADQETGYLTAEPLWNQGSKLTTGQMTQYPTKTSNDTLAALNFRLYDGTDSGTIYTVSGNSISSPNVLSIDNPFIHDTATALTAARQILSQYGGIKITTVGRGDPATEIGDVDTIWISRSEAKTARRMEQSFKITNGYLKDCRDVFLQADGSYLYENSVLLTGSGSWTPPAGVTQLRIVLGQGSQGSTAGQNGTSYTYDPRFDETPPARAENGTAGKAGMIWHGTINVNAGVAISYAQGVGTAKGAYGAAVPEGSHSTFGVYSSANGRIYENGYADIISGASYGRSGVALPLNGSSDGPAAGQGGTNRLRRFAGYEKIYDEEGNVVGSEAVYTTSGSVGAGTPGVDGADGFILVYWDKEAEA